MRVKHTDIIHLLKCPGKEDLPAAWRPADDGASIEAVIAGGRPAVRYPLVHGQPALVDFGHSVLSEKAVRDTAARSPVERRPPSRLRAGVRNFFFGTNRKAEEMGRKLARLLNETAERARDKPLLLIVGGGEAGPGVSAFTESENIRTVAFDIYASSETAFIADAHDIPLKDGSVDAVWIQAVLEHVIDPARVAAEVHRVLRPGGYVYAETPFMQSVHEGAYDFLRFSQSGHRWLFRRFEEIESGPLLGPGVALIWALKGFFAGILRNRKLGTAATIPFFWLRFFDAVIPDNFASDAASATYFLGIKAEPERDGRGNGPLTERDLIRYYNGAQ